MNIKGFAWCIFLVLSLIFSGTVYATQVEMSSSLNPVGSGARATGMGGAYISIADDATAASWNPAGLVQLEKPELSVVYSYFGRSQNYSSDIHPEIEGDNFMSMDGINYASAVYPFVLLDRNMVVSLNYQRLYEMGKDVKFDYTEDLGEFSLTDNIHYKQAGDLYALSPAVAFQVTPELYFGGTFNFWDSYLGHNGWNTTYDSHASGNLAGFDYSDSYLNKSSIRMKGFNANIGFLWNFYGPLTLGGVYKTAFDARLRQNNSTFYESDWDGDVSSYYSEDSEYKTMKMPASYGLGLSYRHSDSLTVALDAYRTEWSHYMLVDESSHETNPIDGASIEDGRLKDTIQARLGGEYLIIRDNYVIPLRAGLFYDPEPYVGDIDDYYGLSFGTGFYMGPVSFDISYQYRWGDDVHGDISGIADNRMDVAQQTIMSSVIYYFR